MFSVGGQCHCFTEKFKAVKPPDQSKPDDPTPSGCCSSQPPANHPLPPTPSPPALSNHPQEAHTPISLPASFSDYFPSPLPTTESRSSPFSSLPVLPPISRRVPLPSLSINRPQPTHVSRSSHYTPYPQTSTHPSTRLQVRNLSSVGKLSNAATPEEILRRGLKELVGNYVRARMETTPLAAPNRKGILREEEEKGGVGELPSLSEIYEDVMEDVLMVSTCTCGDGCECPNCKEHGNHSEDHVDCPDTCSS